MNANSRRWRANHKKQHRAITDSWNMRNRFAKTLIVSRTISKQNGWKPCTATKIELQNAFTGYCHFCGKHETDNKRKLAMDHNHETGEFRFWLCANCNRGLGYFQDDPELLEKAAQRLRNLPMTTE